MKQIFSTRAPLAFAAFFLAAAIVSCGDDPIAPTPTPAAIAASTSPPATAQVATAVQGPAVLVTDAGGSPAAGVVVDFDVTAGGGALQFSTVTTDANGIASSGFWQIGPTVGVNTAAATVAGLAPVTFSLTSQPGPASSVSISSGNAQAAPVNTALPNPLAVRVTDAGGNARAGETVTFAVLTGGGSIAGATATTNAQGIATSGAWTLGPCRAQTARATSGSFVVGFSSAGTGQPSIAPGGAAAGSLDPTDCTINGRFSDEYDMTTAVEAVDISLTAATFNALLNVSNGAATTPIATNDNSGGTNNSFIRLLALGTTKTVTATSASAGETGPYALSVASAPSSVTDCTPTFIEIGVNTTQTLTTTDCQSHENGVQSDGFIVYLTAGQTVRITMDTDPLDSLFQIYSPAGALLREVDSQYLGANETTLFAATVTGFHKILATSFPLVYDQFPDPGHDYGAYFISVVIP